MKARINFDGEWMPSIELNYFRYSLNERMKRSLKVFFIFLICAVVSILIPVLHFVLVPLFLILSLVLSFKKLRETKAVDPETMICPSCKFKLKTDVVSLNEEASTIRLNCNTCRKTLTIIIEDMKNDFQ